MKSPLPVYPFDSQRCIGSVLEISPEAIKVYLPQAGLPEGQWILGNRVGSGEVGEFVFVESGLYAILGRIIGVHLQDNEYPSPRDDQNKKKNDTHPVGTIQLLASINIRSGLVMTGMIQYPRLGANVFSAHPKLIMWIAESSSRSAKDTILMDIASLPKFPETTIKILPENLFGRHCAVVGTTGSGKSWSVATLIEKAKQFGSKVILIDPSGEYYRMKKGVRSVHFGDDPDPKCDSIEVILPYFKLTEQDLSFIFAPGNLVQAPKLRAAMKSLKLIKLEPGLITEGLLKKANQYRQPFEQAYVKHSRIIESPLADFDMKKLVRQLEEECIFGTSKYDSSKFGPYNDEDRSICVPLMSRIEDVLTSPELACIFRVEKKVDIMDVFDEFIKDPEQKVLRISMKYVSFAHHAREIVANALGRNFLSKAREGIFINKPLIIFLDEAHHFLNKTLGDDEGGRYKLDSYDSIAKEGRKYSLTICLATQRPRDIPEGILSQVGSMLVHRLINERDRSVIESACEDLFRSMLSFLPNLHPGEALFVGVGFPIPLTIQLHKPEDEPDSRGPDYQKYWSPEPVPISEPESIDEVE